MWTSTTGFSINVLMLDHKLRQRLHYSFDSDFHVRPGYIIAFRKELISWKQKSDLGDKIAIFVRTTNGSIHYISNMKLLEIKKNWKYLWVFLFQKMYFAGIFISSKPPHEMCYTKIEFVVYIQLLFVIVL